MSHGARRPSIPGARKWEEFYRNRFQHDKRVRTTHGVNCTGSCSWEVFVKDGIVTWELQATDYPQLEEGLPPYEPRGCQRGISFSWYLYSPIRVKYPYVRGVLLDLWREAQAGALGDPVEAWASHPGRPGQARAATRTARGKGGFRRISWDEALEIVAASTRAHHQEARPRPGRRLLADPGHVADQLRRRQRVPVADGRRRHELLRLVLRPAARLAGGLGRADRRARVRRLVQRQVHRRHGRQPQHDPHARHPLHLRGAPRRRQADRLQPRLLAGRQVRRLVDPVQPRPGHRLLAGRRPRASSRSSTATARSDYFQDYTKQYTDLPVPGRDRRTARPGKYLRANRLDRYADTENGDWKLLMWDARGRTSPACRTASIGDRWATRARRASGTSSCTTACSTKPIDPELTFLDGNDGIGRGRARVLRRREATITARRCRSARSRPSTGPVHGHDRASTCSWPSSASTAVSRATTPPSYDDADAPYTPAWQEQYTGIHRDTVIQFAREWGRNGELTNGKNMIIIGAGANHWYHNNLLYRVGHHRPDADRLGRRQRRRPGPLRRPGEAGLPCLVGSDRLRRRLGHGAPPAEHALVPLRPLRPVALRARLPRVRLAARQTTPSGSTTRSTTRPAPCARAGCRSSRSSSRTRSRSSARPARAAPRPTRRSSTRSSNG